MKEDLRRQAEQDQKNYDAMNYRDDQFDLSDTMIALAISLLALTALTHKRWLHWLAILPTVGGVVMGLAGLLGWHLHPDALSRLLSRRTLTTNNGRTRRDADSADAG